MILVTGGAGFIGSNFVHSYLSQFNETIVNLDKLTYAGNLGNLQALKDDPRHVFVKGDICDRVLLRDILTKYSPRAIIHFAAESHVDRSIHGPSEFVQTNVMGTFCLLDEVLAFWKNLPDSEQESFRFIHVSTDEVYGTLELEEAPFHEGSQYAPNSPYSASKAAADHFARAYHQTYGLPTIITNCSNNYGPYQFPEKLIPLVIHRALLGESLPVYGDGAHERNWLYVEDHCRALQTVLREGVPGEVYNIGAENSCSNLEVIKMICSILDEKLSSSPHVPHASLMQFIEDRPGHDRRYDIDSGKITKEIGWKPSVSFKKGMEKTVLWYLENNSWLEQSNKTPYKEWIDKQYGEQIVTS